MKIKIKKKWRKYQVGDIANVHSDMAKELIKKKIGEPTYQVSKDEKVFEQLKNK